MSERRIVDPRGLKDEHGQYLKPEVVKEPPLSGSLDDILNRQLLALERVTRQLVARSTEGNMTRDEIQSLATVIKVTVELKEHEKELIDELSDAELEKFIK